MLRFPAIFVRVFAVVATAGSVVWMSGCGSDSTLGSVTTPSLTVASPLAAGTVGSAYSSSVVVGGGTAPYACLQGTTSFGLSLSAGCAVTGTPTQVGTFTIPVAATDSSVPQRTGSASVSITINPAPLVLTLGTLPTGVINYAYNETIGITGGTAPYTCTVPNLPGWASLSGCTVSGLPSTAGTTLLNVTVKDSGGQTVTGVVSLTISAAPVRVQSGDLAMIGASVQMYAAGTTGSGSAPTALLSTPLTTDVNGGFTIPATGFTCPTATSIVYLVATGGRAGVSGVTNPSAKMVASPGACSNLSGLKSFAIDEATTVASAYAFAQFMATGGNIGAPSTNLSGITLAAGTEMNLVDVTAGTFQGPAFPTATGTLPIAKLNLLATLLNNCVAETSSTACSGLFAGATVGSTTPTNTLDAALNLVKNPSLNVTTLYALAVTSASSTQPYTPLPTSAPADWTLFINYAGGGMNDPSAVSIDSTGRVWVANYFSVASLFTNTGVPVFSGGITGNYLLNSYGGAVDPTDNFWVANEQGGPSGVGTVTVLGPTGVAVSGSPYTAGGLNFPISVSFDSIGDGWVVDYGNSHLSILTSSGAVATGSSTSGYTTTQFVFPVAVAVDSNRQGWVANQSSNTVTKVAADGSSFTSYVVGSGPSGVAVDKNNNVWTANYYGDSIGLVSSAGTVVSPTGGFTGGGVVHPQGITTDGAGTVWITNYRGPSLSELAGASTTTPGAAISPAAGWAPDASLLEAFGVAIDASGNLWVTNFGSNVLTEFVGLAAPVKTPVVGRSVAP